MKVAHNLIEIEAEIKEACNRVSRDVSEVKLIAVTKYVSVERAQEAIDAGILNLGENRIEGLLEKKSLLKGNVMWHFIGSLQTRKVKSVIEADVDYIHSLDRHSLALEIEKRAHKPVSCFIQVNSSGEESKHGLSKEDVVPFIQSLSSFSNIKIVGLMTMAPLTEDQSIIRQTFRETREIQEMIKRLEIPNAPCTELSMGMSNDFGIAIEEGATYIRIGTSLVG